MREARDSSGSTTSQYFAFGQNIGGANNFYTKDHLGSIREMLSSTGSIVAQYTYDPYGRVVKLQGVQFADFQYADYYMHGASGLNLTLTRVYSSLLGRFVNRDILEESASPNLFQYTNSPTCFVDPTGTTRVAPGQLGEFLPYDHVGQAAQNVGCRGVVDQALGMGGPDYGWNWPERSGKSSLCLWGDGSDPTPAAEKIHCHPPNCPAKQHVVIWCKQGNFFNTKGVQIGGNSPGDSAGYSDMNTGGDENYNYSVWTVGGYQGANSPTAKIRFGYFNEPKPIGPVGSSSICCGTCVPDKGR
jgi:RHS repeat-associated protein